MKLINHSQPTLDSLDSFQINKQFETKMISSGNENLKFSFLLANYLEKEYVSLFSSGSSALFFILKSLELTTKKDILIPNYICESVIKSILLAGLNPILYDNDFNSWVSSCDSIKNKINNHTGAIIVNHTFGIIVEGIDELAKGGVPIIEDCCHSFSNTIGEREISKYSICSFFSFDATKWITTGNGGAVATNNKHIIDKIESLKVDDGIPDMNCSLGINQLKKIEIFKSKRNAIAYQYFKRMPLITKNLANYHSIYFRFPILVDDCDLFFKSKKVAFRKGVDSLLNTKYKSNSNLINSEKIFNKTVSIPIYPSLTSKMIDEIISEIKKIYYGS